MERLDDLERLRIQERMSLRHKRSKWAKKQGLRVRDSQDQIARSALEENERMYRDLTKKLKINNKDGEEHDSEDEELLELLKDRQAAINAGKYDPMNPWTKKLVKNDSGIEVDSDDVSFSKFKRFWEEVNKRKIIELQAQKVVEEKEENKQVSITVVNDKNLEMVNENESPEERIEKVNVGDQSEEKEYDEVKENEESNSNSEENKLDEVEEKPNKRRKLNKKRKPDDKDMNVEVLSKEVSIDAMFDAAEVELREKVKRRLEKLGVDINKTVEWKTVKKKKKPKKDYANIQEFDFTSKNDNDNLDEGLDRAKTMEDMENLQTRQEGAISNNVTESKENVVESKDKAEDKSNKTEPKKKKVDVDPTKFMKVDAKSLRTAMPDSVTRGGEGLDDSDDELEENPEDLIREAFEDDYLIDEFKSEKEAAIKKGNIEISLALPGWGDWTGPNIEMSNRKRKRFRMRTQKLPRKDSHLGNVIYNEEADVHENIRKVMVSDIPYPFKSVKDFEASIRAPIGRMFVPENAHKRLTAPPVVTKMGTIINPIDEDQLLKRLEEIKKLEEISKNEDNNNNKRNQNINNKKRNYRGNQKGQKNGSKSMK